MGDGDVGQGGRGRTDNGLEVSVGLYRPKWSLETARKLYVFNINSCMSITNKLSLIINY
ncbi:hypothetical protein PRLR5107_22450 [Prevotella lacticifex]|uniref:Uncharacterized protein n=1 Tax=Prevotella lacticifex TaxID=2854755 RepID=A0A9R1C7B3_9BACT|nr:hypothetical protein PRLR5003_22450 [Prevotella lacticifex]GJG40412.1 hypothetical protein PRLR5019_23830 [Prevotella lacticifex]GJG44109.1 hypothetical protein PRLR5025_28950 [Prevotella lacticifex]GJG46793.1 hypothetical protein PRLR5027_23880 [Prevotella lacticifex]GJG50587.1 hypothetical protein PRLR5052_30000 [Prevotella lacticifex]